MGMCHPQDWICDGWSHLDYLKLKMKNWRKIEGALVIEHYIREISLCIQQRIHVEKLVMFCLSK